MIDHVRHAAPARIALIGLALGCSDYGINEAKPERDTTDTGAFFAPDSAGEADTAVCLGEATLLDAVGVDESCVSSPVTGTLDAVVEWELGDGLELPEYGHVLMAPVVGPLRDGDADGDVDADDPPCIVVVADDGGADANNTHGVLRVLDGRDGTPLAAVSRVDWGTTQVFPYRYSNAALGDLDGDGVPEIVAVVTVVSGPPEDPGGGDDTAPPGGGGGDDPDDTGIVVRPAPSGPWSRLFGPAPPAGAPAPMPPPPGSEPCRVAAYTPDGALRWLAEEPAVPCGGHAPALADLEGDGTVEVIVGPVLLEGASGAWRASGDAGGGRPMEFAEAGWMSFAADLDGDGTQEVVSGAALYAPDGTTRCVTGAADGFPAAADLDADGAGEVVVVASGWLRVHDADCAPRASWALLGEGLGGPPTIGDLDADGLPEIGVATAEAYTAYEADGTVLWSVPVSDWSSSSTGAAFFDFDGDGGLEVVYADETALWILDGRSGDVRLQDDAHSSRTLHELPVVVDVDGDGLTEIVVPNGGTHSDAEATGLYVLGSADGSWATNRRVWNQHAYSVTNVDDDLGVPATPTPNWPTWNTFRSGTVDPVSGGALPDAVPVIEVCTDACADGRLVVDVAVGNQGMAGLRGGVPVTLYVDGVAAGTTWTDAVVGTGGVSAGARFEVASGATVRVAVDDDGTGAGRVVECAEDNNAGEEPGCP